MMNQTLCTVDETAQLISSGRRLLLAGDETALRTLPRGEWIAGTIPYFMTDRGGVCSRNRVFVTEVPDCAGDIVTRVYEETELRNVYRDAPSNGLSVIVLPGGVPVHQAFAIDAPAYDGFGTRPLVGWIAGVHLDDLGKASPKVFLGESGEPFDNRAVVMHMPLPPTKLVDIDILNPFQPGTGDAIAFPETGFKVTDATIGGVRRSLAEYIATSALDTRLPLVADYGGTSINVSVQSVDAKRGEVTLYAPVFRGVTYRHARPIGDYVAEFTRSIPERPAGERVFSCNCILNYVHSHLEGRTTGDITGPVTFGEIAYQLLNQTMVYVTLIDA